MDNFYSKNMSKRIDALTSILSPLTDLTIADIGCDHGLLSLNLLGHGAKHVICSDISEPSLQKAVSLFEKLGLSDKAQFHVSDGLKHLKTEVDAIVIAGMGGELISRILSEGSGNIKNAKILMQPMGGTVELRTYLYSSGFSIEDEFVIKEHGRFYQIISARKTDSSYPLPSNALLEFGEKAYSKRDSTLKELLERVLMSRTKRMEKALKNGIEPPELKKALDGVKELLENW